MDNRFPNNVLAPEVLSCEVLAEERHTAKAFSLIMIPALIGPVVALWTKPSVFSVVMAISVVTVAVSVFLMMWSGFRYRFLRHGVEIFMLGFRLRSIPRNSIVNYAAESWSIARGYGIRGVGRSRAYTWGNKVVHIQTTNGDIYLGHEDPSRIVEDLNMVTDIVSRG
jgi:hypothetical protein